MKRNKLLARHIALHGIRNGTEKGGLEDLHCGISPSSKTGDFSDVKVVTPYGEIAWKDVSRISDKEMRVLMLSTEKKIKSALDGIEAIELEYGKEKSESWMEKVLWKMGGATWDLPKKLWETHWSKPYKGEENKLKK